MKEKNDNRKKIVIGVIIAIVVLILLLILLGRKEVQYKITFDSNGGTSVQSLVVDENGLIVEPEEPTKEGYEFAGWYYNDELYDFGKEVTKDMELEAKWAEIGKVSGVKLDKTSLELNLGDESKLVATVMPNGAKNKSVTWESSDSKVVSVDANGNIKALKAGKATITVTTKEGNYTAEATITVKKKIVDVTGVELNKKSLNLTIGDKAKLTATIKPSNATNKELAWTSSNTSVATVDASGNIKALKEGTATITVTTKDGNYKATCTVKVTKPVVINVTGVTLNKTSLTLVEGNKSTLTATVKPSNATNKGVTWASSNTSVVTVDSKGNIKAVKPGTATITVTTKDGNYKATCTITVTEKPASYKITFAPIVQEGTGAISQYTVAVQKNGSAFSDYKAIEYNGVVVKKVTLQASACNENVTSATIVLNDGSKVTATVVYKK